MRKHTKVYLKENGYTAADTIMCEIRTAWCQNVATDICHIEHKGMGGSKLKDVNENLVAGCRACHNAIDGANSPLNKDELKLIAQRRINANISDRPRQ